MKLFETVSLLSIYFIKRSNFDAKFERFFIPVYDTRKKAIGHYIENNVVSNLEIILTAVYSYRKRIPLLIKAGMGMQILEQMNAGIESKDEQAQLRIIAWNGIIFNCIQHWNNEGYKTPIRELAMRMTGITQTLQNKEIAVS